MSEREVRLVRRSVPRGVGLLVIVGFSMGSLFVAACEPRTREPAVGHGPVTTPTAAPTPAPTYPGTYPTPAPTPTPTPATTPTPGFIGIPGLGGMPTSPRAALIGRWRITSINGKTVPGSPTGIGGSDPMDPATYVAGSSVEFTATEAKVTKGGMSVFNKPYKVLSELPPLRVVIDAGSGPSNVDFALDGSCVWSMSMAPPVALTLSRAP